MTARRVWAPRAGKVELEVAGKRVPMVPTAHGWWQADVPPLAHGTDYAYVIDGRGPFPDPRSPWQPMGFEAPSRSLDHARFDWHDALWEPPAWRDAVLYELHVGTFTREGTFDGAIQRLAYLADLGITHVELMPVVEFAGSRGWGYDGVNLYAPHHRLGGPEGLKRFVDACHAHGLAVILDVVYNHLGPLGNRLAEFGPYFTDAVATPWGSAVNVDGGDCDEVRRFFIDNTLMWLRDYHIDGLRLDAVHAIIDTSALPFLEQLGAEVRLLEQEMRREFVVIVESNLNDTRYVRSVEQGGFGLDAVWNDDHHHALHTLLTGERFGYYGDYGTLHDLARVLGAGFCYDNRYSTFRARHYGRSAAGIDGACLVASLQNHDQVGNRGAGERLGHLVHADKVKLGAALTLLGPCVPMLFQGEEWNASTPFLYFTDFPDPGLGDAVREGRKQEFAGFGWNPDTLADPQEEDTWRRSQLCWRELTLAPHDEMLQWYRALIRLRRGDPAFAAALPDPVNVACSEERRWLRLVRGRNVIVCNFSDVANAVPLGIKGAFRLLLASSAEIDLVDTGDILLPPWGVAVFTQP